VTKPFVTIDVFFQPLPRVPMPMSYKRPRGGKVKLKINPPVPPDYLLTTVKGKIFHPLFPNVPQLHLPRVLLLTAYVSSTVDLSYTDHYARLPTPVSKTNLTCFLLCFKDPLTGNSRRRRQLHEMRCTPLCSTRQRQGNRNRRDGMRIW
jgi:hypothetical protein